MLVYFFLKWAIDNGNIDIYHCEVLKDLLFVLKGLAITLFHLQNPSIFTGIVKKPVLAFSCYQKLYGPKYR